MSAEHDFNLEYLKTNDLVSGTVPSPGDLEPSVPRQSGSEGKGESTDNDLAAKEREEHIERWMADIKSFIRKIDVSQL